MRINFFGGPGAGKSTTAAKMFATLKEAGKSVEQATEYVKSWAYQNRDVKAFDQIYLLGKQMHYEYRSLSHGVHNVVTDSPVFLSYVYAKKYFGHKGIHEPMLEIIHAYERENPSLNIFLDRGDKPYDPSGRWQDYEEAKELDSLIRAELVEQGIQYYVFDYKNYPSLSNFVLTKVE